MREAADHGGPVERLELVEATAVHKSGDHLARIGEAGEERGVVAVVVLLVVALMGWWL